jgi:hypothetical protein
MQLGSLVVIEGMCQRKNAYTSKAGVQKFLYDVANMGGMFTIDLGNKPALDAAPDQNQPVRVIGRLVRNSFGGFDVLPTSITLWDGVPFSAASGEGSPGRRGTSAA